MKYQVYTRIESDIEIEAETEEQAIDKAIAYTKKYGDVIIDYNHNDEKEDNIQ